MSLSPRSKKICSALCAGLLIASATAPAQAALVGSGEVLSEARAQVDRQQLVDMIERDEVSARLEAMGVDPADARARVERMTDAEVAALQERIGEVPAGGDALGVALFIFLVFVITDALGATDIFPFINEVN